MTWTIIHAQHIGARDEQQDRVATFQLPHPDTHLCVLADGMGGHARGAEAAQAVINAARPFTFTQGSSEDPSRDSPQGSPPDSFGVLERLCNAAHAKIRELGTGASSPGSTCVALLACAKQVYWAHIGDSRLYQFRDGRLIRATEDHSMAMLVARKSRGAARAVANHAVYRRLGGNDVPLPDYDAAEAADGDTFLLSSDGFWDQFSPRELAFRMNEIELERESLDALVYCAVTRAGARADNASVLLARWHDGPQALTT
jgi:serine/threonine protein phosphatase PrpC